MEKRTEATEEQIDKFLNDFRERMRWVNPPIIYMDNRDKNNIQQLASLDLTGNQRDDIIKGLTAIDYMEGPYENNWPGQGDVWVFGKEIKGKEVYIKIYINTVLNKPNICISFHISESRNQYPLKTKEQ